MSAQGFALIANRTFYLILYKSMNRGDATTVELHENKIPSGLMGFRLDPVTGLSESFPVHQELS